METATEANGIDRELTATERAIAIAQINDRLTRMACAFQEVVDKNEEAFANAKSCDEPDQLDKFCADAKSRFSIPAHMEIRDIALGSPLMKDDIPSVKKFVEAFVRGTLSQDDIGLWIMHFEEFAECDFGWVLLGKSFRYYEYENRLEKSEADAIVREVVDIGTRSTRKKSLPPPSASFWGEKV